jgi:transposase
MVDTYQMITVGDVSSLKLVKTRMAKSVLDSGWGALKTQLQYKGQQAGRVVQLVSERNSTRACSNCGALTGPSGAQHQHRSRSCPPADRGAPECRERDARFQGIELRTYARQRQQYADRGSE